VTPTVTPTTTPVAVTPTPKPQPPKDPVASLFSTYAGEEEDGVIAEEKLESFFKDMSVDPDSRLAILFAKECGCEELGVISKEEFGKGLKKLAYTYQNGLSGIAQELRKKDTAVARDLTFKNTDWKELYTYGFNICKENAEKRGIEKSIAVGMLKLLMGESKPHVTEFCGYLEHDESVKVISQDAWTCFCEFSSTIKKDLSNYDEDEAWPCLIDQYVAFRQGRLDENSDMLVK